MWKPHRNVNVQYEGMRRAWWRDPPPAVLDLIDVATYVYCADQAVKRGGPCDLGFGRDWRRRFVFRIAVRQPDLWRTPAIQKALVSTLSFLSEDEYHFEFESLRDEPPVPVYFPLDDQPSDVAPKSVVLFSGGLDSLAGAVKEAVAEGRRILLVSHRPTTKLARRQDELVRRLQAAAPGPPPLFLPVTINKDENLTREYTQRSRSFLYASLGAAVAVILGLDRVRFYENGVVSLNLPPSPQVVGARATRTTHPLVLRGFATLFSALLGKPFFVENAFQWKTKSEVVRVITEAGCSDLIRHSNTCTHTWEMTNQFTHCGKCSQCIDRRFAVLAAGASDVDPAGAYRVDLLTGERKEGIVRTMLAAYVEMAKRVGQMSPIEFLSRFGEVARVLRGGEDDPETTALRVHNLYQRHAQDVGSVVTQAIRDHAHAILSVALPASCLVRLVCDASGVEGEREARETPAPVNEGRQDSANVFLREGKLWRVRFAGGQLFHLVPKMGVAYLHVLLSNAGRPMSLTDLVFQVRRDPKVYGIGDAGETLDNTAFMAYKVRAAELSEGLRKAKQNNDPVAEEEIRGEMDKLAAEAKAARGLGGRTRKAADDHERLRKAVRNAVTRALKDIADNDRRMAEHLQPPQLNLGCHPCYQPSEEIIWET
jgi:hypothetical protein